MKKSFPIGSLDKTKRFMKTAEGWVSVKKLQKGNVVDLPAHPAAVTPKEPKEPKEHTGRFPSIYAAQIAWLQQKITHAEYLVEQAALYESGVISKQHSNVKLR